jgi:hypothetical protein
MEDLARSVQAPNSLLLIMDPVVGRVPEATGGRLTAFTDSCVAIGTLSETDGPTRVRLLASAELPESDAPPMTAWQGVLATPTGELVVTSVTGEIYARRSVRESTPLRLLVNDETEPDEIWIVVE